MQGGGIMLEGLEQSDINKVQEAIANYINDLAIKSAEKKGRDVSFEYGKINGLLAVSEMLRKAQGGDL